MSSTVSSAMGRFLMMAALLTMVSRRPHRSRTAATIRAAASESARSSSIARQSPPADVIDAATASHNAPRRPTTATASPRCARRRAIAAPIPLFPPVTRATRAADAISTSSGRLLGRGLAGLVFEQRTRRALVGDEAVDGARRERPVERRYLVHTARDRDDIGDRAKLIPQDRDRAVVKLRHGTPIAVEEARVHVAYRPGLHEARPVVPADVTASIECRLGRDLADTEEGHLASARSRQGGFDRRVGSQRGACRGRADDGGRVQIMDTGTRVQFRAAWDEVGSRDARYRVVDAARQLRCIDTRHRARAQVMDDVRERAAPRDPETRAARKQPFDELGCDRAEAVVGAVRSVGRDDGAREAVMRCELETEVDVLATRRPDLDVNDAFAARTLEVPGHGRRIEAECLGDLGLTLAAQIEPG